MNRRKKKIIHDLDVEDVEFHLTDINGRKRRFRVTLGKRVVYWRLRDGRIIIPLVLEEVGE